MGKRGPQPKGKIRTCWSANFAYGIGLMASDGSISSSGRHISFASKDLEQINNFLKALNISDIKIGKVLAGDKKSRSLRVQFGDILFCNFLKEIGILQNKSKTIGRLKIPQKYLFDFLRGSFDGDGTFYSYWDKRWKSSHMFYLEFSSASMDHINWIRHSLKNALHVTGHINQSKFRSVIKLKYAKREALEIISKMYYNPEVISLSRKRLKIERILEIEKNTFK
jgi:intein/homing endonuclease